MKAMYPLALVMAAVALVGSSAPLRASEMDDSIESAFKNSFVYKTYLKDEHIKISSKDGAVTLLGSVANETQKQMAQNTAKALPGVKSVDNRFIVLLIVNAHETDAPVIDRMRRVPFVFPAQKEQPTEFAKEVKVEMSVAKASEKPAKTAGEGINDASITANVKKSLSSDRLTRVLNTKITTINGIVSIGGKAGNGAQKDLVTKLVTDVNGVKSVVNHMSIEETLSKNE